MRNDDYEKVIKVFILSIFSFLIGLILLSVFIWVTGAKIVHASTEFESIESTGSINLQLTGNCCSGPDNFRQYTHIYYPGTGFSFNKMRFFASGDTEIPLSIFIIDDNGSTTVSAQSIGNVANLAGLENDTQISQSATIVAYSQGTYYEADFSSITVESDQYVMIIFASGSGGYTDTNFETSPQYWSYKSNELADPSPFTTFRQTVTVQLCDTVCNPFGALNGVTNTNIFTIINDPQPYGTTTASTTVDLSVSFHQSANFNFGTVPAVKVGFDISDAVTEEIQYSYATFFDENTNYSYTYSTTTTLEQGSKVMTSYIRDLNGNDLAVPDETFFNVATNTYLQATGLNSPRENPGDLTQINCELFDVGCQFQKALVFVFKPSDAVLNRFANLWQQVRNKVPFGYVSAVIDQLEAINANETPAFSFGEIPFMDSIFTPLRNLLAGILWGIYSIYFYRNRLTTLDI